MAGQGKAMTWFFVLFGGIVVFGWIVALLDWLAERKESQTERRSSRAG